MPLMLGPSKHTHTHTHPSRLRECLSSQLRSGRTDKCVGYHTVEIRVQSCRGQSTLIHTDCDTVDKHQQDDVVRHRKTNKWTEQSRRLSQVFSTQVLVVKPEGKRPLGRPRRRWEDNIKMDLQEMGRGCGYWMELAQDKDRWWALVSAGMNFGVP